MREGPHGSTAARWLRSGILGAMCPRRPGGGAGPVRLAPRVVFALARRCSQAGRGAPLDVRPVQPTGLAGVGWLQERARHDGRYERNRGLATVLPGYEPRRLHVQVGLSIYGGRKLIA